VEIQPTTQGRNRLAREGEIRHTRWRGEEETTVFVKGKDNAKKGARWAKKIRKMGPRTANKERALPKRIRSPTQEKQELLLRGQPGEKKKKGDGKRRAPGDEWFKGNDRREGGVPPQR